jgi:hypothetical protein
LPRKRTIQILTLAQRIAAELESGRVDDVELSDEQVQRLGAMLAPAPPAAPSRVSRTMAGMAARGARLATQGAAASSMVPILWGVVAAVAS